MILFICFSSVKFIIYNTEAEKIELALQIWENVVTENLENGSAQLQGGSFAECRFPYN
jgi:hypothetical protein